MQQIKLHRTETSGVLPKSQQTLSAKQYVEQIGIEDLHLYLNIDRKQWNIFPMTILEKLKVR